MEQRVYLYGVWMIQQGQEAKCESRAQVVHQVPGKVMGTEGEQWFMTTGI